MLYTMELKVSRTQIGPKIWDMFSDAYKNQDCLYNFKKVIRKRKPQSCPCRICKVFVKNVRFCEIA